MKISTVTLTGADNGTNQQDLLRLSKMYPFVEWGILFSMNRSGQPRYPSNTWIREVSKLEFDLSAHFCGWYAQQVLESQNFHLINILPETFNRVQLNYNFAKGKDYNLMPVFDYAEANPGRSIILQHNKSNERYLSVFENVPSNIHYLYDSSGGRGSVISEIKQPIQENYTGYAGGIGPENIQEIIYKMDASLGEHTSVWVDMESKLRSNNDTLFDLGKCEHVLNTCYEAEVVDLP